MFTAVEAATAAGPDQAVSAAAANPETTLASSSRPRG